MDVTDWSFRKSWFVARMFGHSVFTRSAATAPRPNRGFLKIIGDISLATTVLSTPRSILRTQIILKHVRTQYSEYTPHSSDRLNRRDHRHWHLVRSWTEDATGTKPGMGSYSPWPVQIVYLSLDRTNKQHWKRLPQINSHRWRLCVVSSLTGETNYRPRLIS
jgi:hypothetical protein